MLQFESEVGAKKNLQAETSIADLIKGAFGLAAAKGAVQVFSTQSPVGADQVDGTIGTKEELQTVPSIRNSAEPSAELKVMYFPY
jgi:hypothetical protein